MADKETELMDFVSPAPLTSQISAADMTLLELAAVSVKLPDFYPKDPELWLMQADSQFALSRVVSEHTQFHYIISRLPTEFAAHIKDIIKAGYQDGSLALLKEALITRISQSKDQQLKEVQDEARYDPSQLPSEFFRHILSKAEDLPYDVILQRFRESMPELVAEAIAPMLRNLEENYRLTQVRDPAAERTMLEVADVIQPRSNVKQRNRRQRYSQSLNSSSKSARGGRRSSSRRKRNSKFQEWK